MTTNAGLDDIGLNENQKQLYWEFLSIVKVLKEKAGMNGATNWNANNIIAFMEGKP